MPRFDLEQALQLTQQHKVTRFYAVPPVVLALAKHPIVDQYDLSSVVQVFSGAAPLGAELAAEASARIGCEVVQGYGMTELSPVSHCTPEGDFRPGTSGITVPNTEIRIVDPVTGRGPGRRRRGRAVDPRPAGDEGLPQQRRGHARSRSTTTAGCTPATSRSSTSTTTSRSSTG